MILLSILLLTSPLGQATNYNFPRLSGRVVDQVGLLDAGSQAELVLLSEQHEAQTGNQIVVAIVKSLDGKTIDEYAVDLFRHWGLGQKDKNNGVLLLIAPQDRKMRIEVGYGLEANLTDARCANIINNDLRPAFQNKDFKGGIKAGVVKIIGILSNNVAVDDQAPAITDDDSIGLAIALIYFAFFIALPISYFTQGRNTFRPAMYSGAIFGILSWIAANSIIVGLIVGAALFLMVFAGLGSQSGSFRSGSFRSGGGGGFSGGGGSSGGGGASGGW